MDRNRTLRGSCSCGRNQYAIEIPQNSVSQAEVYFDASSNDRRIQATPLTAWLRVPLLWYQSCTTSYFPDETHSTIRREFVPPNAPFSKRHFCGYCGTPLTYWSESPPEEAEYMSVTIGSLFGEDQAALEDLDLLPADADAESVTGPLATSSTSTQLTPSQPQISRKRRFGVLDGIPWFEEMIEGSRLGRVGKRRRGVGISADRSARMEWEVSEWRDDRSELVVEDLDYESRAPKRKTPEPGGRGMMA
ncbi:hypothetical protein FQN55_009624 [Onygenales sp. PD_40]|nr:hypothetical protein FQN55_009624 [Onygenales sp. PD_40]KAK2784940.1 hypothetical protein FQN53_008126 [Emmonsiellopsis sp. PD_33]KAK2792913.1 hypothetical protein FQN52_002591 [Onygenales sp. PD_12]KAK2805885.1 hypothetical protein FQN51_008659 [Onygenales sp. PD_10]